MTDESDLIRNICLSPHDDVPRLIYAEWLDDHRQSRKANAIRAHIEAEMKYPGQAIIFGRLQYAGVEESEPHKLLSIATNYTSGLRSEEVGHELSDLMSRNMVGWRRGLIEEITLPLAMFVGPRECPACKGRGKVYGVKIEKLPTRLSELRRMPSVADLPHQVLVPCDNCHGSGRVPGIAKELFGRWPVTKVTFTEDGADDFFAAVGQTDPVNWGRQLAGLPPLPATLII
jgi:uncharacterized protein (TIGR02996 family)